MDHKEDVWKRQPKTSQQLPLWHATLALLQWNKASKCMLQYFSTFKLIQAHSRTPGSPGMSSSWPSKIGNIALDSQLKWNTIWSPEEVPLLQELLALGPLAWDVGERLKWNARHSCVFNDWPSLCLWFCGANPRSCFGPLSRSRSNTIAVNMQLLQEGHLLGNKSKSWVTGCDAAKTLDRPLWTLLGLSSIASSGKRG